MARKGISYDAVANAARAIKARGQEPTIAAVRMECGDEGSFTTISAHIAKWRAEEADKVDTRSLPAEVEDKMMEALMVIWNVANKAATADVQAIKQEYADEKKRLQAELTEARDEIKQLEKVLKDEEERANRNKEKAEKSASDLTAKSSELDATKELYKQLLTSLKPPAEKKTEAMAADTKPAHPKLTKVSPESKQA